jgi:Protein of unknown function (DUF2934)
MTEKPAKRTGKRAGLLKPKAKRGEPSRDEIAERAYFMHLEDGACDALENWLRAERELTAA